jgi:hypothetical protein
MNRGWCKLNPPSYVLLKFFPVHAPILPLFANGAALWLRSTRASNIF